METIDCEMADSIDISLLKIFLIADCRYSSENGFSTKRDTPLSIYEILLLVEVSEERMWENYEWFISQVMPVAEEAGVRMGLHPDDPPVSPLQGIARIFTGPDAIRRALSLSDSPSHGLTFCQGTYVTMGAPVADVIREWKDRIFFVHQRDVAGTAENFHETFHDNGPTDMAECVRIYEKYCPVLPVPMDFFSFL